jgi:ATP-dependent protease ClpP protease subunit
MNPQVHRWYSIRARGTAPRHADLLIYGDIGASWSDESVTAGDFVRELQALDVDSITVRINSFGGSVPDGLAIFNALRRFDGDVEVAIDGVALSIASLIAMGGDHVVMASTSRLMIHAPWSVAIGNATALREQASVLDGFAKAMTSAYARPGVDVDTVRAWLTDGEDHWLDAEQALEAGFIDAIVEGQAVAASFDISRFNPPASIAGRLRNPTMHENTPAEALDASTRAQRRRERLDAQAASNEQAEIRMMFAAFKGREGVDAMLDQVLAERVSPAEASRRLLAHLGRDAQPARPAGSHPYLETLQGPREAERRELMVEAFVARVDRTLPKNPAARPFAQMTPVEMAREMLAWHGARRDDFHSPLQTIQAAITHGSGDFPFLLQETGNRLLRRAYESAPGNLKLTGRSVLADDFRPLTRLALSEAPKLERVNELAEYTHGTFAEAKESYGLETFGRMFNLSRRALVNDDLGMFSQATARFGVAAAEFEAQYLVDMLVLNSGAGPTMGDGKALFHTDHKNKAASAGAISVTTIGDAVKAMRTQKGLDGVTPINVTPRFLVVPAALEMVALQYLATITANDSAKVNPWAGQLTLLVEPRLDAVSASRWYVVADPAAIDGLEYAYMGEAGPAVEMREGWEVDGVEFKIRLDFGAAWIDWRSWYVNG